LRFVAWFSTFVLFLLLTLAGHAHADELIEKVRVVDGDTLAFGAARVRLSGIDAPETHQTCQDRAGQAYRCGLSAAAALIGEIGGAPLRCTGNQHDRYRRLIATCFKGNEDLNGWMVAHGWALAYRHYSDLYMPLEDAARRTKAGIWAGDFEAPWVWRTEH
jgi:endonuclease YncB( thermonuclease family)